MVAYNWPGNKIMTSYRSYLPLSLLSFCKIEHWGSSSLGIFVEKYEHWDCVYVAMWMNSSYCNQTYQDYRILSVQFYVNWASDDCTSCKCSSSAFLYQRLNKAGDLGMVELLDLIEAELWPMLLHAETVWSAFQLHCATQSCFHDVIYTVSCFITHFYIACTLL